MEIIQGNIPNEVYELMKCDWYDHDEAKGTVSATSLIKPTRELILLERHYDKIKVQAIKQMWKVLGSSIHAMLEKIPKGDGDTREERLFCEVGGEKISGKYDRVLKGTLIDYKVTSAWTLVFGDRKSEWIKQLSILRYLYWTKYKIELNDKANIVCIFRDWVKYMVRGKYPTEPSVTVPIKLFSIEKTEKFIESRVKAIQDARKLDDLDLPLCSLEERWWNEKKSKCIKCHDYCDVAEFCSQFSKENI